MKQKWERSLRVSAGRRECWRGGFRGSDEVERRRRKKCNQEEKLVVTCGAVMVTKTCARAVASSSPTKARVVTRHDSPVQTTPLVREQFGVAVR